ncbi:MAG: protease SohB, partial [Pseudohongiellaceae bacterium]
MAEFFSEYGIFLAKTITLVLALVFLMAAGVSTAMKGKKEARGHLEVTHLNQEIDNQKKQIRQAIDDKHLLKLQAREDKRNTKNKNREKKKLLKNNSAPEPEKRVFVINFEGDLKASQVENLRHVITSVLTLANPDQDEIILRLESPGGIVHGYGLAASQLNRIRSKNIPLTICVDKVAASGGYMMACIANRIVAAPFAVLGSIGVVISMPNFHRLLEENKVDYEMITAGEYKRTLSLFGENTEKGREKVQEDVQEAHLLFKNFILENRPQLNIDEVATGEIWF